MKFCEELEKLEVKFDYIMRVLANDELFATKNRSLDALGVVCKKVKFNDSDA